MSLKIFMFYDTTVHELQYTMAVAHCDHKANFEKAELTPHMVLWFSVELMSFLPIVLGVVLTGRWLITVVRGQQNMGNKALEVQLYMGAVCPNFFLYTFGIDTLKLEKSSIGYANNIVSSPQCGMEDCYRQPQWYSSSSFLKKVPEY